MSFCFNPNTFKQLYDNTHQQYLNKCYFPILIADTVLYQSTAVSYQKNLSYFLKAQVSIN